MSAPRLSIVMPVYNALAFLPRTFEMLAAQTDLDFELIAVDDGSTDGSGAWLDAQRPPFALRVIHQPNAGAAAARNAALELATGEYLAMVDADDILHPRAWEWSVAALDETGADFAIHGYRVVREEEADGLMRAWTAVAEAPARELLGADLLEWFVSSRRDPGLWQFVFRRVSLSGMKFVTGIMYEDNPFVYGYLAKAKSGVRLGRELYGYVQHARSVMHATDVTRKLASIEMVLRTLHASVSERQYRRLFRACYARTLRGFYREAAKPSYPGEVRRFREATFGRMFAEGLLSSACLSPWWYFRFWLCGRCA